jgi:unsaturated chondroitin disaccharide hydrolase
MKSASLLCFALLTSSPLLVRAADAPRPISDVIQESFTVAAAQYTQMLRHLDGKSGFPRTVEDGQMKLVRATDWTSGFFPGSIWYLFEATGDPKWREAAAYYTARLESAKNNTSTHDVGFILYTSYGNGLRLTGNPQYREVLRKGAESLSTRFNPTVGCIQSWPTGRGGWSCPVIIDNMMNLELLAWAARDTKIEKFRAIAMAHADTTWKNHFRPDGSSFHVVDYDPATGAVKSRQTHQGAADDSAWARGQAWGLYGYTMMYRETSKPEYLAHAQKIAAFIMNHPQMPADKVPYWDFNAPGIPNAPRDSSAAAVMSSALFELSRFVSADDAAHYRAFATDQLRSLASSGYLAKVGENDNFILLHATGNLPAKSEIDAPINYADYYFLEALLRCKALLAQKG